MVKIHRVLVVGGSEVMTQRGSVVGCGEVKIHRVLVVGCGEDTQSVSNWMW